MIDCQDVGFSSSVSQERIAKFQASFGFDVLRRVLALALFLLGATRRGIAQRLDMSPETVKSFLRTVQQHGLPALEDRRRGTSSFLPEANAPSTTKVKVYEQGDWVVVDFGLPDNLLRLPRDNSLQVRVVLLSLLDSGLLQRKEVAECLRWSGVHTSNQAKRLQQEGVSCLLDKRGQKKDYVIDAEVKGEIIQQFVLDLIRGGKTSGKQLSEELDERCGMRLSERSIRHHLEKLGLSGIRRSLPSLIEKLKKNS